MPLSTLPTWARELIERERVGRLGLLDEDARPRVLPVTYALAGDSVWSAIDRKPKRPGEPARVRWLRRRAEVALTVDVYDDDWSRLAWVQLLGTVAVIDAVDGGDGLAALAEKYEQYRDEEPPGPLLRLEVERALWWRAQSNSTSNITSSS